MIPEPADGRVIRDVAGDDQSGEFRAADLEQIESVCTEFESAWKAGKPPDLRATLLTGFDGQLRSLLFAELLALDIHYRIRLGQSPTRVDYETRFPDETRIIESVFVDGQSAHGERAMAIPEFDLRLTTLSFTSRYQLTEFHARGGLGVVYVAQDQEFGRRVAVKFARRSIDDSVVRQRLKQEAQITGRLEHPGVVPVYATGHHSDGNPCYVMQMIEGDTLDDRIRRIHQPGTEPGKIIDFQGLEFRQLLGRFIDVCNTTAYAHSQQIIHRDIKPANIMLGRYGETFLLDWGLAKSLTNDRNISTDRMEVALDVDVAFKDSDGGNTKPGHPVGTLSYASPEQIMGDVVNHGIHSDIYSLGATLYCLIVGFPPVEAAELTDLDAASTLLDVRRPREVDPRVPGQLDAICLKAMAFETHQRYCSATMLADDLEHFLADESIAAYPEPRTAKIRRWIRKSPWKAVAVASSLLIGLFSLAIGSWLLGQKNLELSDANQHLLESRKSERLARTKTKAALDSLTDNAIKRWLAASAQMSPADRQFLQSILSQYQSFADVTPDDMEAAEAWAEGCYRVAQLQSALGNRDDAIATCLNGLESIEQLESPHSDKILHIKSTIQSLAGSMLTKIGKLEQAESLTLAAVQSAEDLIERNPDSVPLMFNYRQQLDYLGIFYHRNRDFRNAEKSFRESLDVLEKIPAVHHESAEWRKRRGSANYHLGLTLQLSDNSAEAIKYLESAFIDYDRIALDSPDLTLTEQIDHCSVLTTLASVQTATGQFVKAHANLDRALVLAETLADKYPLLTEPIREVGNIWYQKSGICFDNREYEQSIGHAKKAITAFERQLDRLPGDLFTMSCLSNTHGLLAGSHSGLDAMEPAIDHCLTALSYAQKLFDANPAAFRHELITRLFFASNIHNKRKMYAEIREFAGQALLLIEDIEDPDKRLKYWDQEIGFRQLLGWSLMSFDQHEQAFDQWQAIVDETEQRPLFGSRGEDVHLGALVERAICLSAFDAENAIPEIDELAKRDDLTSDQVYKLSLAAAAACRIEEHGPRLDGERVAIELLRRAVDSNYFSSAADFNKLVRQHESFSTVVDHEEFQRIEQSFNN